MPSKKSTTSTTPETTGATPKTTSAKPEIISTALETTSTFLAIDLKSFYASVECVERGLDPFETNLVVADASRTDRTICLAISPHLKSYGLPGRARLFEVKQRLLEHEYRTGEHIDFLIAPPRMQFYLDYSRRIYNIYASYVSKQDLHSYSIDEVFIDATSYLKLYAQSTPKTQTLDSLQSGANLATKIIHDIHRQTGITATAGIGTNLYLAKVAMDILAKHAEPDSKGVRIATLDEQSYKQKLWHHQPLTDFWRIGPGTARKLTEHGITTLGELARVSLHPSGEDFLFKLFGLDAEILIDHAWGLEPCTITDIKNYRSADHSLSSGQVLPRAYSAAEGEIILREMVDELCLELTSNNLVASQLVLDLNPGHKSTTSKKLHGSINFDHPTNSSQLITASALKLYHRLSPNQLHRLNITLSHVTNPTTPKQASLFSQPENPKDQDLQRALLAIKAKFGKNAILRGTSFQPAATGRSRNAQIGGHQA